MLTDDDMVVLIDYGKAKEMHEGADGTTYYKQRGAVEIPIRWTAPELLEALTYANRFIHFVSRLGLYILCHDSVYTFCFTTRFIHFVSRLGLYIMCHVTDVV